MAAYDYVALSPDGKQAVGVLQADSAKQARQQLRDQSMLPVDVSVQAADNGESSRDSKFKLSGLFQKRFSTAEKVSFTRQLSVLVASGIPIDDALQAISEQQSDTRYKRITQAIRSSVRDGRSLSDALAEFPRIFPTLFISMVRAGEQAGALSVVLERLADYLEGRHEMNRSVTAALIYPVMLTVVSLLVIGVLMAYVVPRIVSQFEHASQHLPFVTELLIMASEWLQDYGVYLLLFFLLSATGCKLLLNRPAVRMVWHRWQLNMPLIGELALTSDYVRFSRTLEILLHSGLPLLDSLRVSVATLNNHQLQQELRMIADRIQEGEAIVRAMQNVKHVPGLMLCMIANGEKSGELPQMFGRIASMLESKLKSRIKVLLALFEPLLILMMGGAVLFIVLSILLPILELNNMTML